MGIPIHCGLTMEKHGRAGGAMWGCRRCNYECPAQEGNGPNPGHCGLEMTRIGNVYHCRRCDVTIPVR